MIKSTTEHNIIVQTLPVDSITQVHSEKSVTPARSAETNYTPRHAAVTTPRKMTSFASLRHSGETTSTSATAKYIDTLLPISESNYDRLVEFYRHTPNAKLACILRTFSVGYHRDNHLAVTWYEDRQQGPDILYTSENYDSSKPFSDFMQESYIVNEPQNAEDLQALKTADVKKGGTVGIMHGNSGLMFQLTFLANAGLLPSVSTVNNLSSLPDYLQWMTKEEGFPCYLNISSLYNASISVLVNKHNFDILVAKFFHENYEMVNRFKKSFSLANNNAGNSEQALSNKNSDATKYIRYQPCLTITEKVGTVEENNNNDCSETALSNSAAIQQKGDSYVELKRINEAVLKKISRGGRTDIGDNQLSHLSMKFN